MCEHFPLKCKFRDMKLQIHETANSELQSVVRTLVNDVEGKGCIYLLQTAIWIYFLTEKKFIAL